MVAGQGSRKKERSSFVVQKSNQPSNTPTAMSAPVSRNFFILYLSAAHGASLSALRSGSEGTAAVVWSNLGKGFCGASAGAEPEDAPCTCQQSALLRGGQCSPFDLRDGLPWCYVKPSCPNSRPTGIDGFSWSFCPPAANPGAVYMIQPAYVACRSVSTLEECQDRCLSKELSNICTGVSWGATAVCYFYIDKHFAGSFPASYLKSSACEASVNISRADISGVVADPSGSTGHNPNPNCNGYYDPFENSCDTADAHSCTCKGIVDERGQGQGITLTCESPPLNSPDPDPHPRSHTCLPQVLPAPHPPRQHHFGVPSGAMSTRPAILRLLQVPDGTPRSALLRTVRVQQLSRSATFPRLAARADRRGAPGSPSARQMSHRKSSTSQAVLSLTQ